MGRKPSDWCRSMSQVARPPTGSGPLQRQEARLAWGLLFPTIFSVALVVLLPLLSIFWISVKPVQLADLRAPRAVVSEALRGGPSAAGDEAFIENRLRNSHSQKDLTGVTLSDTLPDGISVGELDSRCQLEGRELFCDFGAWDGGHRERLRIGVTVGEAFFDDQQDIRETEPVMTSRSENVTTSLSFSLENFARVFDASDFWSVLWATVFYTVFGTIGALIVGLFAAMLLNIDFRGKGILRGLYLFLYVAPVIAVAFTWVTLFDPFSGSVNALLLQMGVA